MTIHVMPRKKQKSLSGEYRGSIGLMAESGLIKTFSPYCVPGFLKQPAIRVTLLLVGAESSRIKPDSHQADAAPPDKFNQ